MPPFSSFPFLEVSEWWFLGQGKSSICGYLNFGPIRSWADTSWGPFVCCGLWGALGSSAQWSQRGPGLTCQDLKNINLKNIVKNKYLGGKWSFFFFPTRKLLVEGLDGLLFLKCYCCSILDHFEIFPLSRMSLQGNGYDLGQRAPEWKSLHTFKECLVCICSALPSSFRCTHHLCHLILIDSYKAPLKRKTSYSPV